MAFGEGFRQFFEEDKSIKSYKTLIHFFVHECGWTQKDFDEADLEFMLDVIDQHIKLNPKNKK